MGLQCSFDVIGDLGYPEYAGSMGLKVNYGPGTAAFVSVFQSIATMMVPVRTGFLRSTIGSSGEDTYIECYADADYAQYVEYGTSRMGAQPYFEPALEAAFDAADALWQEAIREAKDASQQAEQAEQQRQANAQATADQGSEQLQQQGQAAGEGGGMMANILAMAFYAVVKALIDEFLKLFSYDESSSSSSSSGTFGSILSFVTIT